MRIPFTKMHGLGNSYIFINVFDYEIKEEYLHDLAIAVADKDFGIGSDGLILIHPTDSADIGMRIFNNDGSEGKNCGNGLRCVAKFAYENNLVEQKQFTIETKAGNVIAEVHGNRTLVNEVTVNMGKPHLLRETIPMEGSKGEQVIGEPFIIGTEQLAITTISMGNPHAVFFVEDINEAPLITLGPLIERDARFPEGVNVEFIEIVNDTEIHFRVWERGSGVTQACGTGACASVVASVLNGKLVKGKEITVHLAGGDLYITWDEKDVVWMRGKAETTIEGIFNWSKTIEL